MANSLRAKLSKLRHDGNITDAEYQKLIAKLDGHDKEVRTKALSEMAEVIKSTFVFTDNAQARCFNDKIDEIAEQLKEE